MRVDSRSVAKGRIKEMESLRNHLAHAQDIVAHDWAQIARMAHRVEELLKLTAERTSELQSGDPA